MSKLSARIICSTCQKQLYKPVFTEDNASVCRIDQHYFVGQRPICSECMLKHVESNLLIRPEIQPQDGTYC